ncbi:MAG: acetylglutamate kinase, partial [Thermoprotei archaeon]
MPELVVIKLGGSLITDKQRPLSLRREALSLVSRRIAEIYGSRRLVIIHGGGSFGHFAVLKAAGSRSKLVEEVRYWMTQLNLEVVGMLRKQGVPAVGLPPMALAEVSGGGLRKVDVGLLDWLLEAGLVPVTHGGLVRTESGGLEVVSGDTLASELAVRLGASALVYLMDVDGVYT